MIIILDNRYYIFEYKVNESVEKALKQIEEKYVPYLDQSKIEAKIGVNWDRKKNKFEVKIVLQSILTQS